MAGVFRLLLAFFPITFLVFGQHFEIDLSPGYKGALYKPLSEKYDRFDWKFFQQVAREQPRSMVVSPYSVKVLLYLIAIAARGHTFSQISVALADKISMYRQLELYGDRLKLPEKPNEHYDLSLGRKLFLDMHLSPKKNFLNIIRRFFKTSVEGVWFSDASETADRINKWASDMTKGKITNLVDPSSIQGSVALLATAIYFKGSWEILFNSQETENRAFKVNSKTKIEVPTMYNFDIFYYLEDESELGGVQVLRLGYKGGRHAMTLLLPLKEDGLDNMIAKITPTAIKNIQRKLKLHEVKVFLPKFQFETTSKLKGTLQELGIDDLFTGDANLPDIGENVEVSDVVEKAGVTVDEKGTEIYAIAEGYLGFKSASPVFRADHPFAFFLEDEELGDLLFAGKVVNPQSS